MSISKNNHHTNYQSVLIESTQLEPSLQDIIALIPQSSELGDYISPPDTLIMGTDSKALSIKQIREVISWAQLKPYQSPIKLAVIHNCHLLSNQAQNALLKLIEEPPINTLIVLVTKNLSQIIPTVKSRTQIVSQKSNTYAPPNLKVHKFAEEMFHANFSDRKKLVEALLKDSPSREEVDLCLQNILKLTLSEARTKRILNTNRVENIKNLISANNSGTSIRLTLQSLAITMN